MKKKVLYLLFLGLFFTGYAQHKIAHITIDSLKIEQKKFDEDRLEAYKTATDFKYNLIKNEPNFLEHAWNWLGRMVKKILAWGLDDIGSAVGTIKAILEVIPYVILGVALYFIIRFFMGVNQSSNAWDGNKRPAVFASDEEELIKNENLEQLIQEAVDVSNYKLAVRYYYLLVLKKLSEKELVIWRQEKTNEEYVAEINKAHLRQDFMETTRVYDFVWYGNFEINETDFKKVQALFITFTKKIVG